MTIELDLGWRGTECSAQRKLSRATAIGHLYYLHLADTALALSASHEG